MSVAHAPDVTDKFSRHFIRRVAREMVAHGTFPVAELDDLIQELQLALVEQAGNFDGQKGRWSTFVKTVVGNAAISLRRRSRAQCRQVPSEQGSLNVLVRDADGGLVELGATVDEQEYRTGLGIGYLSHTEQVDLALDVGTVLEKLPHELREIARRLQYQSLSQVADALGVSRHALRRQVKQLRSEFAAAGLADGS